MYRVTTGLLLIGIICFSCKKELSGHTDVELASTIDVVCDGESITKSYSANQYNEFSQYSFGGVAGTYFGYISKFDITTSSDIEIRIGTILSLTTTLADTQALNLLSPGTRKFGSLGSFTSFPDIKPDCAEIAYVDKDNSRWSSTAITEEATPYGIAAAVETNQPDSSEFVIDKVKPIAVGSKHAAFHITGHFRCLMHRVNDDATKAMSGTFKGVVSSDD